MSRNPVNDPSGPGRQPGRAAVPILEQLGIGAVAGVLVSGLMMFGAVRHWPGPVTWLSAFILIWAFTFLTMKFKLKWAVASAVIIWGACVLIAVCLSALKSF